MAHNNLAIALRSLGEKSEGDQALQPGAEVRPNLAESYSNLGQSPFKEGRLQEDLVDCREAVKLRPDFPEAHTNLGIVYRGLGRSAEAKACYADALRLNPELAVACNKMGQVIQEEGNLDESITWYGRSLELDPNSVLVQCNMATALKEQNKPHEAIAHYDMVLRLDPNSADAHNGRGWVRHEQGDLEEALFHYRKAVQLRSDFALAHCNLGTVLEEFGDMEGSSTASASAAPRSGPRRSLCPAGVLARRQGARSGTGRHEAVGGRPQPPRPERIQAFRVALRTGPRARRPGRLPGAAEHLRQANALGGADWKRRGRAYDPADHADSITKMIATCTPAFFERVRDFGVETERPVFIVGLPRSGTTLTEQILASHSQVLGAGELSWSGTPSSRSPGS